MKCNKLVISMILALGALSHSNVWAKNDKTYADLQTERHLSAQAATALSEDEMDLESLKIERESSAIRIELLQLAEKERELKNRSKNKSLNQKSTTPNTNIRDITAQPQITADQAYTKQAQDLLEKMKKQIFLIELSSLAGKYEAGFITDGTMSYASKGDVIGGNWVIKNINMKGVTLEEVIPNNRNKGRQIKHLALKSREEALAVIKQTNEFNQAMINSRLGMASTAAIINTNAPGRIDNTSPTAGLLFE